MPISTSKSQDGKSLTIKISGRFIYDIHREFRQAYENTDTVSKYIIDLKETQYIDSSALGMLLLLQEYVGGKKDSVEIINSTSEVANTIKIANFDQYFKVS